MSIELQNEPEAATRQNNKDFKLTFDSYSKYVDDLLFRLNKAVACGDSATAIIFAVKIKELMMFTFPTFTGEIEQSFEFTRLEKFIRETL